MAVDILPALKAGVSTPGFPRQGFHARVSTPGFPRRDFDAEFTAQKARRTILGGHVIGEYSAEIIQVIAACMMAGMSVEQIGELPSAFPTFTQAVSMAAQKFCRRIDVGRFPAVWSYLGPEG